MVMRLPTATRKNTTATQTPAPKKKLPEKYVPDEVYSSTRALLHVKTSEEAAGIVVQLVRRLGGEVVPASDDDPNALDIDLSLGHGDPVYPSAPEGSAARWLILNYVPRLVEDARVAFDLVQRAERLASDAGVDLVSGLPDHQTLSRLVTRLETGDAVVAVDLDWIRGIGDGQHTDQDVLRRFARDLRSATRANEFCGRSRGGEFVVLLEKPGTEGAHKLLERLKARWDRRPDSIPHTFSAGIAPVDDRGWRAAIQAADRAMRRSQEAGDSWLTASAGDYDL